MKSAWTAALIGAAACVSQGASALPIMSLAPTHTNVLDFSADGVDAELSQTYRKADSGLWFSDEFTFTIGANNFEGGFKATTQVSTSALTINGFDLYTGAGAYVTGVSAGDATNNWALSLTALNQGSYVLEIDGQVTGALGGRYAGTASLSDPPGDPLPVPATLSIMTGGLAMMGLFRRRKAQASA
ncbi:FxDxF family PEP-CTERM protein [Rugamonas sp.]|uniref:FxDxF family PEP-CTERM protein n=1 Tax=Rugamonas sp. TaxID=1926287 RepID=UPI0025CE71BD|nr:FxDxF family PEP-CTERM protein [Rugamonas sp.]